VHLVEVGAVEDSSTLVNLGIALIRVIGGNNLIELIKTKLCVEKDLR
jgi:hypothetical protein